MSIPGSLRRHRVAVASTLALLAVAAGLVVVATQADGYRKHEAQLNDGGIWVTNGRDGFHGRVNKPIAQLDGVVFSEQDVQLDVVQDGAAVVGVDISKGLISTIDPGKVELADGETSQLPSAAQVQLAGGSLAVLDPADGDLWAERVDTRAGVPTIATLDAEEDPYAATAADAGLAVTVDGEVLVASGEDDVLRRYAPTDTAFAAPVASDLGVDLGATVSVTAVGDTAVVLDGESGALHVVGGPDADLPPGSVLQVPGPDAAGVLVATSDRLVEVDLTSGEEREVAASTGRPAAPVRLGACVYAAWSGGFGAVAVQCGDGAPVVNDLGTETDDLVFRVNRGEIVLNDRSTGAVWNIDSDQPTRLDNWDAFQLKPSKDEDENENQNEDQGDRRPPKAEDDAFGARPGRTTVLHPLDNDTAPAGRLLAIVATTQPTGSDAVVTISPDGQTVQIDLPDDGGLTRFEYTIDDGRSGLSDTATVTVTPRNETQNAPPQLRPGFEERIWTVPSGGTLDIPVLPDWRDKQDGDPLSLVSAVAEGGERSGAVARTTSAGRVRFTAPARGGVVTVSYGVTDGIADPVEVPIEIQVQTPTDRRSVAGVAEPDVVAGEAGKTVTIRPLGNDLPGSDPNTPTASLELAGKIAQVGGADVTTDLVDGTISFRATEPRTYFLDYDLRYGNAPFAPGRIRVDVRAPERPPERPVAMPDSLTLYGQSATLVDVVANDIDPAGGILVVQGARAEKANQLDVAVVEGRWLRIAARQGRLLPNPQLVRYTVSNGNRSGIQGEVVVTWRPAPSDNTPVTETDRAVVRVGGAVSVPVLDNDFSPAGDELDLMADLPGTDAGVLEVRTPGDDDGEPTGRAFVTDRFVRYVAPDALEDAETFTIRYLATNAAGDRAPGTLEVQVVPAGRRNEPPEPPVLEGRTVAGDTVKLRLPGTGVDPDGDPVTLTGIGSAPQLGRIVRFGAGSIVYQAYPGSVGTDEFGYTVTDTQGGEGTGTVRVAVVPPGVPQPPLAVADTVTTEPGRVARLDLLANDHVAPGDRVELALVDAPPGARLETPQGPLLLDAPQTLDAGNVEVVYTVSNGIDSSQATATLRLAQPFNNPPVVFDAYGTPADAGSVDAGAADRGDVDGEGDAATVTVDVLETAFDPDGDPEDLVVAQVFAPRGVKARIRGSEVTVERGDQPRVVPFRVRDADGGSATASIYVPPVAGGAPYVLPGASIELDPGQTAKLDLTDYVADPAGKDVRFTLQDRIWSSPAAELGSTITGDRAFELSPADRYEGPGAVVFEVTNGDSVDDPDGVEALLSVPVQVGTTAPVLRCPDDPIRIAQDRTLTLDVASYCHVYTADPDAVDDLSFDADWKSSVDGLSIVQPSGPSIEVNAAGNATPGITATLQVTTGGSDPAFIDIVVVESPPPSLAPIRLDDMRAGQRRTIDLAPYLTAGVRNPVPTVVSVVQNTNLDVGATFEGSTVTLRTGATVDGRAEFAVVMSDVEGSTGPERQVEGRITLEILDVPDTPTAPVPGRSVRDAEVVLTWRAPQANGAPIDRYEVRGDRGAGRECATTTCEITGLQNGEEYRFEVRAHNAVGWSEWSARSAVAEPDAPPGRVGPIQLSKPEGDSTLSIRWTPPTTKTSAIQKYVVTWDDGGYAEPRRPELTVSGLDNNHAYSFTVTAVNERFPGPPRSSAKFQSIGTPATPQTPTITENRTSSDETAVVVDWPRVDPPNGPGPVRYTVLRGGQPLPQCTDILENRCVDAGIQYDGTIYQYSVKATNKGGQGLTSAESGAAPFQATGEPEAWGPWTVRPTGSNNSGIAVYDVPDANGKDSVVTMHVEGRGDVVVGNVTGSRNDPVTTNDNNRSYAVYLTVCNEKGACSNSDTQILQTYGGLVRQHITEMTPHVSGRNVYWTITVDTNGDPATATVSSNRRSTETYPLNGVDTFTFNTRTVDIGYSNTESLTVRLTDPSPNRGPAERSATSPSTEDQPRPTVTIGKGPACNDSAGSSNPCNRSGTGENCINSSCAQISFSSANWPSNPMSCDFYDSAAPGSPYQTGRQIATNRTVSPGPYYGYPSRSVWVVCTDSTGARAESNHYNWN